MIVRVGELPAFNAIGTPTSVERAATPSIARHVGRLLMVTFLLLPAALAFVPWQQTIRARGQVTAYAPTERKQTITARVSGQIGRWRVVEGSKVKAGDVLVDINDNDPDMANRLEVQKEFLLNRRKAAVEEVAEQGRAVEAQTRALDAAVKAAKAGREASAMLVDVAKQSRANMSFASDFEGQRFQMYDKLFNDKRFGGLESSLNRDEAKMRFDRAATEVKRAEAEIKRSESMLASSDSLVLQAEASGITNVATARRDLRKAEQNLYGYDRDIQDLENRIERFKARIITAPCDGTIFRISANVAQGGQYVKEDEPLAVIVPDTAERVVELMVDGVDSPLLTAFKEQSGAFPHVRLMFEGWPAIQVAGWPSVATGTFGGRVRQVDPTDDGNGRFRVLIEEDALEPADRWPEDSQLRQGNQAVGYIFLNRVSLGYELWRNLNGFPPVAAPQDKAKDGGKPPKVKP